MKEVKPAVEPVSVKQLPAGYKSAEQQQRQQAVTV